MKDDKGGFARFAVALRVIKDEKDGEVKRSVVVNAINEECHGDDFQDDGIDASWIPQTQRKIKARVTHQIFASFPGRKTRKMRTTMICLVDSAAEKVKKALRRWEEEEEEEEDD